MNAAQPTRHYDSNITRNPFEWMGIWTPQGWRTHRKRFGQAKRHEMVFEAREGQSYYPGVLGVGGTGKVLWQDDLHLTDDSFTDGGIYPCDPRLEYPIGQPRWSVSHSLLCFPVADHSLHTHEYTWDMATGDVTTRFRRHVVLEEGRTDARDGKTVRVKNTPISQTIEGNVAYDVPNSAVRGVWTHRDKMGPNLYSRRAVQLLTMWNGVYVVTPHRPVLQCRGVWAVLPEDPVSTLFDSSTGRCHSIDDVIQQMSIPLDEPKLAMFLPRLEDRPSAMYGTSLGMLAEPNVVIDEARLEQIRSRLGIRFSAAEAGYAGHHSGLETAGGYFPEFDFNDNGVIDEDDLRTMQSHAGRAMRSNLYVHSYFGPDWLSICVVLDEEHRPGVPVLADYDYGAGYDSASGIVQLFETPGPNETVWVEYFYDAPAEAGERIKLYRYEEI